ncbi:MAG: putative glycoside hydrolase, partial [Candidatus Paceibacterota bacterium]
MLIFAPHLELGSIEYDASEASATGVVSSATSTQGEKEKEDDPVETVAHVETPDSVRAIYMTTCAASTPSFRQRLTDLLKTTEVNSIVIDIKDYSGGISFPVNDPELKPAQGINCFVPDMKEFIEELHEMGVYVIGRITVFQDPFYARRNPDVAVQRGDGSVWTDGKGLSFT